MRYHTLWPRQRMLPVKMISRVFSVSATVVGKEQDVALLAIALAEITSDQPLLYCPLPRSHAAVTLRIDRRYHANLHHLITDHGLAMSSGVLGPSDPVLTFSMLPLGTDHLTLKKHPRLQWDQSPCRWYVCYDTSEATLYHALEDKVPCAFYLTRSGGLTYCFASGTRSFRDNFLNAEHLSWRTAVGLPYGQVPTLQTLAEEARARQTGAC